MGKQFVNGTMSTGSYLVIAVHGNAALAIRCLDPAKGPHFLHGPFSKTDVILPLRLRACKAPDSCKTTTSPRSGDGVVQGHFEDFEGHWQDAWPAFSFKSIDCFRASSVALGVMLVEGKDEAEMLTILSDIAYSTAKLYKESIEKCGGTMVLSVIGIADHLIEFYKDRILQLKHTGEKTAEVTSLLDHQKKLMSGAENGGD